MTTTSDTVQIYGLTATTLLTTDEVALVEHTLAPRALGSGIHTHEREDEYSYVLEGEITLQVGDNTLVAKAGDVVAKPRGVPHAFWNASEEPARLLELISPAGFEGFFAEIAPLFPADAEPDIAGFVATCARYALDYDLESDERLMIENGLLME